MAIKCGASDTTSGMASNCVVGYVADKLVDLGADDADGFPRLADLSGQPLVVGALAAEAHHQDRCHIGAFAQRDERFGDTVEVRRKLAAALVVEIAHLSLIHI